MMKFEIRPNNGPPIILAINDNDAFNLYNILAKADIVKWDGKKYIPTGKLEYEITSFIQLSE